MVKSDLSERYAFYLSQVEKVNADLTSILSETVKYLRSHGLAEEVNGRPVVVDLARYGEVIEMTAVKLSGVARTYAVFSAGISSKVTDP